MKKSAKVIIALFNKSKSGKSMISVEDKTMFIVSDQVFQMCNAGIIGEVTFAAGGDLLNEDGSVAFQTMRVSDFTETAIAKLRSANAFIQEAEAFDDARYKAAMEKAKALGI